LQFGGQLGHDGIDGHKGFLFLAASGLPPA
jgi:hypothetical protein